MPIRILCGEDYDRWIGRAKDRSDHIEFAARPCVIIGSRINSPGCSTGYQGLRSLASVQ